MKSPSRIATAVGTVWLVALPACQGPSRPGTGSFATVQESLMQIGDKQAQILARLDQVDESIAEAGAPGRPDRKQARRPDRPDPTLTYRVPISAADATKGPSSAKITIVEWSDFQCPFCSRVTPTLEQIQWEYGNDVRVVFKHNPLPMHDRAMAAAIAAEAAHRQGRFWEMHDKLFSNPRALTDENFAAWAEELGLDVEKFNEDMKDPALRTKAETDQRLGSGLGARGTPAFFINGRFLSGAQPLAAFKVVIDEEMKKADRLLASGTAKDELYAKIISKGKTKV